MSAYTEFFLASASSVGELETIELSHPNFSRTYRIVRNYTGGINLTLETAATVFFEYYPLRIERAGNTSDLSQQFKVTIGDVGDTLPAELARVRAADAFVIFPTAKYRTYRSDNTTAPLVGPLSLVVLEVAQTAEGSVLTIEAPQANNARTGEVYSMDRFPMLRGLL
jgi:hypothetical protein